MASQREKVVGVAVASLLIGAIAVLALLRAAEPDPAQIKAELEKRVAELDRLEPEEALRKDFLAEEILANEDYRMNARSLYSKIEKAHLRLHEAAQLDRAAQKVIPLFMSRCASLERLSRRDLDARRDEARAHLGNFGVTRFGPPLREMLSKLDLMLSVDAGISPRDSKASGPERILQAQREVSEAIQKERFSAALKIISLLREKLKDDEFRSKVEALQEQVLREGRRAAGALIGRVRALVDQGQRSEAARLLDSLLPQYKGIPESAGLENYRRQIGP